MKVRKSSARAAGSGTRSETIGYTGGGHDGFVSRSDWLSENTLHLRPAGQALM